MFPQRIFFQPSVGRSIPFDLRRAMPGHWQLRELAGAFVNGNGRCLRIHPFPDIRRAKGSVAEESAPPKELPKADAPFPAHRALKPQAWQPWSFSLATRVAGGRVSCRGLLAFDWRSLALISMKEFDLQRPAPAELIIGRTTTLTRTSCASNRAGSLLTKPPAAFARRRPLLPLVADRSARSLPRDCWEGVAR